LLLAITLAIVIITAAEHKSQDYGNTNAIAKKYTRITKAERKNHLAKTEKRKGMGPPWEEGNAGEDFAGPGRLAPPGGGATTIITAKQEKPGPTSPNIVPKMAKNGTGAAPTAAMSPAKAKPDQPTDTNHLYTKLTGNSVFISPPPNWLFPSPAPKKFAKPLTTIFR
jgi:hypothetical protein